MLNLKSIPYQHTCDPNHLLLFLLLRYAELLLRKLEELNSEVACLREENLHLLRRQAVGYCMYYVMVLSLQIVLPFVLHYVQCYSIG